MDLLLIIILLILSIYYLIVYLRKNDGIYQAPFIITVISMLMVFPQLFVIYTTPIYDNKILINLLIVMISSHWGIVYGFQKGMSKNLPVAIKDIKISKHKFLLIVFVVMGMGSIYISHSSSWNQDWAAVALLLSFACAATILSFIGIWKYSSKLFYLLCLILATYTILDFAITIKGSRSRIFYLLLIYTFFLSHFFPKYQSLLKKCFLILLIAGTIIGSSVAEYRRYIWNESDFINVNLIANYKKKTFTKDGISENNLDLGNAALGIDYSYTHNDYNYGATFINQLISNFIPKRIVGVDVVNSLFLKLENRKIEYNLTNSVTTMTGYYDVFSSFSYGGFILFIIIGYILGYLYVLSKHSNFYLFIYLYLLIYSPIMITHGVKYFVSYTCFLIIFIVPFLLLHSLKKYKTNV